MVTIKAVGFATSDTWIARSASLRLSRNFHRLIPDEGYCLHFQWPRLIDTGRCHDSKLCKVTGSSAASASDVGHVCAALEPSLGTRRHVWRPRRRSRMITDPRNWGPAVRPDRTNDPFGGNSHWNVLIIDAVGITFLLHRSPLYASSLR